MWCGVVVGLMLMCLCVMLFFTNTPFRQQMYYSCDIVSVSQVSGLYHFGIFLTMKLACLCGILVTSADCRVHRWEERHKRVGELFN